MTRLRKWQQLGFKSWEAYQKEYRKIYYRGWYLKNKARHAEYCRRYREKHREERAYRDWYKRHYLNKAK